MKKMFHAVCVASCLGMGFISGLSAQEIDSSHLLKEVEIKFLKPSIVKTNYLNEVYTANSLQSQMGDMYIKNYGIGQLSTFSVRGLGAENVAILWEGLPVNSPMNGLLDLNQVPNSLLQNIYYQTEDSRLTSGGSLSIRNANALKNVLAFSSTAYLSELFSHKLDGQLLVGKSTISFINQVTHGSNRYEYINGGNEQRRLEHNAVQQINTQIFYTYALKHWKLNSGFWYQNQDRQIPESGFYPVQTQSLIDRNARAFVGASNAQWDMKISYMSESQKYNDQNTAWGPPTESQHKVTSWRAVINYTGSLGDKLNLKYHLYPSYFQVQSSSLNAASTQITEAIQNIQLRYTLTEKWKLEGGLKSQINSNFNNLLLPYAALHYSLNNWGVSLAGDINERNPTMNDLYFQFYGNRNLKPETNYQVRNSWKYYLQNSTDKIIVGIEPYFIYSIGKINYVPDSGFRVFNIDKSRTLGINTTMEWVRKINSRNSLQTIVNINYQESKDGMEKHLAYVPNLKTILSLNWIHKDYELMVQNNYTSRRYTNAANTSYLAPYLLTNVKATLKRFIPSQHIQFSIGIDNLWNENFQDIVGGYMPLRNYYFNITAIMR